MAKKFPDLTGDGKVTQADVLKGRGVFSKGSEVEEKQKQYIRSLLNMQMIAQMPDETKAEAKARKAQIQQELDSFDASMVREVSQQADAERDAMAMGSLMVAPEREMYGKGSAVVDLVAALTGKQTKAAKKKMVSEEKAAQELEKLLDNDPRALDDLSDEMYEDVMSRLPQRQQAKVGMADEPLDDMVEMARGMEPAEVAKNLEMFNDIDEIFEYANSLDAKGSRQFMQNLSDEDFEIFGADLPDVGSSLRPREVKAHGGAPGVAILMPAEYEEPPVDTYDNISPEEKKQQEKDMLPDEEMEEEYMDYVAEEVLTEEEQDYLFKALDDDSRLEEILDKVMLNATEFTGSGEVDGPGTGISDSIPARLSDGEFVFTRKATDQIGADKLQKMMDDAERDFDQRKGKANGGVPIDGMERFDMEKDDEETLNRQMSYANRMPSLMNR